MVAYLANGWFTQVGAARLRAEVVDGALDSAAGLTQAGVPVEAVEALHLRVRTLAFLLMRDRRGRGPSLDAKERQVLLRYLQEATDNEPFLQAFALDCLEHIGDLAAMRGFCLHLLHIGHVGRLLRLAQAERPVAREPRAAGASLGASAPSPASAWQAPR